MKKRFIILDDSFYFKKGTLVEGIETNKGLCVKEHIIPNKNFINEELTSQDEIKVKKLIKQSLKLMFWRLYTKSSNILN